MQNASSYPQNMKPSGVPGSRYIRCSAEKIQALSARFNSHAKPITGSDPHGELVCVTHRPGLYELAWLLKVSEHNGVNFAQVQFADLSLLVTNRANVQAVGAVVS